jgi:phasin family protein
MIGTEAGMDKSRSKVVGPVKGTASDTVEKSTDVVAASAAGASAAADQGSTKADRVVQQQEAVMIQSRVGVDDMADRTREAVDGGMAAFSDLSGYVRDNVDALVSMARASAQGFEAIAQQATEFSRKSLEDATAALRALAAAQSPNQFVQLQNDFSKAQFDATVAELSKLSETLIKVIGDVMEPLSSRVAVTNDKLRSGLKL